MIRNMFRLGENILCLVLVCFWELGCQTSLAAAPADSEFFDAKGVKIHYIVRGRGEPVILIHGLDSSLRMNWGLPGIIDSIASKYQVIALDLPGYGESDKPSDPGAYGQAWGDDIILLMDHLNCSKAHIIGYSMGGMIALKLIVQHPDRVLSSVLGGMGYMSPDSPNVKIWSRMRKPSASGAAQLTLTDAEVKSVKIPVEIICGSHDPVKKMYIEPLVNLRPDWPLVKIEGAGHITCIMKDQFKQELLKWLDHQR